MGSTQETDMDHDDHVLIPSSSGHGFNPDDVYADLDEALS